VADGPWVRRVMRLITEIHRDAEVQGHDGWSYNIAKREDAADSERRNRRRLRALLREKWASLTSSKEC